MIDELNRRKKEVISQIKPHSNYFAHPVNYYFQTPMNTHGVTELKLINSLNEAFPNNPIYNPNQPGNQENYMFWKKRTGSGMNYYFDVILPNMDIITALPFEDGMFGAGVFGELEKMYQLNRQLYEISEQGIVKPLKLDLSRKLTIDETRSRV